WLKGLKTPCAAAGEGGSILGLGYFGVVHHRLCLLAQQVPVVQTGVGIVNQNARKKQNPPKRVKCGCVEDA
ncbi:hypothetical protein, partial [Escherichia coli]|uniref:hypothetical protein n=1 Tax=Escherichia coli TaxID=562 RepID=UPI001BC8429F